MRNIYFMHSGTIEWNGSDLSRIGKPKLSIRRQADPPAPACATRMLVTLAVTVELEALDTGTLQARAEWLANSMRVAEGILRVSSGSGHTLSWLAVPGEANLAEVISGRTNSVELSFSAVENHGSAALAALTGASFTPAGTSTPLAMHAIRDMKEDVRTTRHAERNGARSATTTTLSFTARVAQANPAESLATRLAYLQGQAASVKSLDAREGVLVLGSINRIVRVTEFSPALDERRGVLDVTVQCYSITLPDSGTAECVYDIDTRLDAGSGEEVLSLKGSIEAESRSLALAKLETLRTAQQETGKRVSAYSTQDKIIAGFDSSGVSGGDWSGGMSFTLEVRQARSGGHHTLRISTQQDVRSGMRWNYSGTVQAIDAATAVATARAIAAAANHPVLVRSEETIEQCSDIDTPATMVFTKLDFTYEFEGTSDGFISGEITTETVSPQAGEWRRTISGFLIASSAAVAEARLTTLLAGESPMLEGTRRVSEIYLDASGSDATPRRAALRLDFTCGVRDARTFAAVEFTDSTENDISTMRQSREVSGALWSDTEAHAEAALTALIAVLFGATPPQRVRKSHAKIQWASAGTVNTVAATDGGGAQWIKLEFSLGKTSGLTGVTGYDLLEASFSMERTGSINTAVITPIPFGRPVAQTETGYLPGRIAITANAKAINLATARAWVQAKRALATAVGTTGTTCHETEQPRESSAPEYAPFDGSSPLLWSFSGSYGWTYTGTVLDGLWATDL